MDNSLPFENRTPEASTPSNPISTTHSTLTAAAGAKNSGNTPLAAAPAAQPSREVSPMSAAQSLSAERQQASGPATPMRTQADPFARSVPPTATMSPKPIQAGAQTIQPASDISVETKDGEAKPEPWRSSLSYPDDGSGRVQRQTASGFIQGPNRGEEKVGSPTTQAEESRDVRGGSNRPAALDPKLVSAAEASDPTLIGSQYPKDNAEELRRIKAEIRALRTTSIPAKQVHANEHRIRDLAADGFQIKEIYDHLVREKRIDHAKVSYKQFAGQVKIKKFRDSTA